MSIVCEVKTLNETYLCMCVCEREIVARSICRLLMMIVQFDVFTAQYIITLLSFLFTDLWLRQHHLHNGFWTTTTSWKIFPAKCPSVDCCVVYTIEDNYYTFIAHSHRQHERSSLLIFSSVEGGKFNRIWNESGKFCGVDEVTFETNINYNA